MGGGLAFLVSCALLLPLAYGASALVGASAVGPAKGMVSPVGLVEAAASGLLSEVGLGGTLTVVLVGTALLTGVSLKVSQLFYRRRNF